MKINQIISIFCLAAVTVSCKTDTLDGVDEGISRDRSITEIKFENQIGVSQIERDEESAKVTFSYNLDATGALQIPLTSLVVSVGAHADVKAGDVLDFDNADHTAIITVYPSQGEPLDWTIQMKPFTEPLKGTWGIQSMWVYGGVDRGDYGGDDFKDFGDIINTLFEGDNLPKHELDNIYTFEVTGYSDSGNAYGTVTNDAGPDGLYAAYKYASTNSDADGKTWDCESIYRKIATEGGMWEHDTKLDIYYFRDRNNQLLATGSFRTAPFTYKFGANSKSKDFPANTLVFDVSALGLSIGNWDKNYTTAGIVVYDPAGYLISLEKK